MNNIAEILKFAPKGLKLYSIIHGEVEFDSACHTGAYSISVRHVCGVQCFDEYGKYFDRYGECILFPSKDHRTWDNWQKVLIPKCVGSVIVSDFTIDYEWIVTNNGMFAMNMNENETYSNSFNEMCYDDIRFATSKESKVFFERLDKLGYKFENGEVVKKEEKKWSIYDAKDGDFIFDTTCGGTFIFKGLDDNRILRYASLITEDLYIGPDERYGTTDQSGFRPATTEELQLLLGKLMDEGYCWDADRKEIKKIEDEFTINDFKPFDRVLVRDSSGQCWNINLFSHYDKTSDYPYKCLSGGFAQCIPYNEETAYLLGTDEEYNGKYKTWEE